MGTKYTPVFEDDATDLGRGIPEQTDEEAANETAMNSPAARARRSVSDAENQIRADAVAKLASKAAPVMDEEASAPAAKMPMRPGQASSGMTKTPMVTKEQLAASGLSLRDYLNKQQGLTRRGESSAMARMPTRPGQEAPMYSNEGRNKKVLPSGAVNFKDKDKKEYMARSLVDQGRDVDLYGGTIDDIKNAFKKDPNKKSFFTANDERIANLKKGGTVKKMASGGSVSSASKRADGIAQRGKTKGKMC
jgi:hypothetical protein